MAGAAAAAAMFGAASKRGVSVAIRTRPTAAFASDLVQIDADKAVRRAIGCLAKAHATDTVSKDQYCSNPYYNYPSITVLAWKCPIIPQTVRVHRPSNPSDAVSNRKEEWGFKFDSVLHNCEQEMVYESHCRGVVQSVIDGEPNMALRHQLQTT